MAETAVTAVMAATVMALAGPASATARAADVPTAPHRSYVYVATPEAGTAATPGAGHGFAGDGARRLPLPENATFVIDAADPVAATPGGPGTSDTSRSVTSATGAGFLPWLATAAAGALGVGAIVFAVWRRRAE
ncbi:hypothetical protein ACFVTY_11300 [Streptomyces sp. NPDC058067]|uniref:hypothetical protein n=1 Tax=Streptomyces sp. NPDC058067 TaxID=3346324 RepID=UPI0036EFBBCA